MKVDMPLNKEIKLILIYPGYWWPRGFVNGPEDQSSIPGRVIPKPQKIVLDAALLNTQYYKLGIKGKVEQSRERSWTFPHTLV